MVFDAKYKRMKFRDRYQCADLDRSDFFQIHTYMSYYHNQKDTTLIAGGLLYPMEGIFIKDESHSDGWLENDKVQFVVDGIDLSLEKDDENKEIELTMEIIKDREDAFIERIEDIYLSAKI